MTTRAAANNAGPKTSLPVRTTPCPDRGAVVVVAVATVVVVVVVVVVWAAVRTTTPWPSALVAVAVVPSLSTMVTGAPGGPRRRP